MCSEHEQRVKMLGPPGQRILPPAADQDVLAAPTDQNIVARQAKDDLITTRIRSVQHVVAMRAVDCLGAVPFRKLSVYDDRRCMTYSTGSTTESRRGSHSYCPPQRIRFSPNHSNAHNQPSFELQKVEAF